MDGNGLDALSGGEWDDEAVEVPISALEHYSYCPRQCGLIHVEQTWGDNVFTVRGTLAHARVDAGGDTPARGVRVARGAPLWSERYGLRGKADLVEFRPEGPYPVEYKVGRRQGEHADLQLCAQALCLEEMLGVAVPRGAIYYHGLRRRHEVVCDAGLRARTVAAVEGGPSDAGGAAAAAGAERRALPAVLAAERVLAERGGGAGAAAGAAGGAVPGVRRLGRGRCMSC